MNHENEAKSPQPTITGDNGKSTGGIQIDGERLSSAIKTIVEPPQWEPTAVTFVKFISTRMICSCPKCEAECFATHQETNLQTGQANEALFRCGCGAEWTVRRKHGERGDVYEQLLGEW